MKIVKTKTIEAKNISEIFDESLISFKDRAKLHDSSIPDFFVYIQDLAWNAFINHGNNIYKESKNEAQGIFIGHYFKDQFGEFVVAIAYEEGSGNSQPAYVEMSGECLTKIAEKCQNDNLLILISAHTHPGFGAFYSGTDNVSLRTYFYKPYQIGIVVDILKKQDKGFKTKGNDVVEFSGYALFNIDKNILFSPYSKIECVKKSSGRIDELTEEVKRLKNDYLNKTSEVEQCEKKIQLKEKEIDYLVSDLQSKKTEIKQIREELQSKEKNIEALNSDLSTKTFSIDELQGVMKSVYSEIKQLKEELQSSKEYIKELEEDLQNKISEINQLKTSKGKKFSFCFWRKKNKITCKDEGNKKVSDL